MKPVPPPDGKMPGVYFPGGAFNRLLGRPFLKLCHLTSERPFLAPSRWCTGDTTCGLGRFGFSVQEARARLPAHKAVPLCPAGHPVLSLRLSLSVHPRPHPFSPWALTHKHPHGNQDLVRLRGTRRPAPPAPPARATTTFRACAFREARSDWGRQDRWAWPRLATRKFP